jgi:hypothetical protein
MLAPGCIGVARIAWYCATVTLPRPPQAIQVAAVQKAVSSRAEAEAALPPDVVLPYLELIGRVRLFREREPATQLRASRDQAKRARNTDAVKQLVEQLESLGFDERVHVPTANELYTQIRNFVSTHYDRAYDILIAAKKYAEAAKCTVLFEELTNEADKCKVLFEELTNEADKCKVLFEELTNEQDGLGGDGPIAPKLGLLTKIHNLVSDVYEALVTPKKSAEADKCAVAPPATSDNDGGISRPFNFQHVVHVKVNNP